jgi:hypothetical protein
MGSSLGEDRAGAALEPGEAADAAPRDRERAKRPWRKPSIILASDRLSGAGKTIPRATEQHINGAPSTFPIASESAGPS